MDVRRSNEQKLLEHTAWDTDISVGRKQIHPHPLSRDPPLRAWVMMTLLERYAGDSGLVKDPVEGTPL